MEEVGVLTVRVGAQWQLCRSVGSVKPLSCLDCIELQVVLWLVALFLPMALLIGPMMSMIARGSIGEVLTFKCGHIAAKKKFKNNLRSDALSEQQQLFKDGASVWSEDLSFETKQLWWATGVGEYFDLRCNPQLVALPFAACIPIERELLLTMGPYMISQRGYDLWMSWYLTLGPSGWPNYPNPPPVGWVPKETRKGKTYWDQYWKYVRENA